MLVAGSIGLTILSVGVGGLVGGGSGPGGRTGVVVDVIRPTKRIDSAPPSLRRRAALTLMRVGGLRVLAVLTGREEV